jgi:hypothetical protein
MIHGDVCKRFFARDGTNSVMPGRADSQLCTPHVGTSKVSAPPAQTFLIANISDGRALFASCPPTENTRQALLIRQAHLKFIVAAKQQSGIDRSNPLKFSLV